MTPEQEAAIRADEEVQRRELVIRDGMNESDDPFEWLFSEPGRVAFARLGGARVKAAIQLRRSVPNPQGGTE